MKDYRVKVTVRNAKILRVIEDLGFKSVAEFCRTYSMHQTALGNLISMKIPPVNDNGYFNKTATTLLEVTQCLPEELWNPEQLHMRNKKSSYEADVTESDILKITEQKSYDPIGLIEQEDHNKVLKEKLIKLMDHLSPRNRNMILEYRGLLEDGMENPTYKKVAHKYGISTERLRQIEVKFFRQVRHPIRREKYLSEFVTIDGEEDKHSYEEEYE